jgi:hypothetical protein
METDKGDPAERSEVHVGPLTTGCAALCGRPSTCIWASRVSSVPSTTDWLERVCVVRSMLEAAFDHEAGRQVFRERLRAIAPPATCREAPLRYRRR